MAKNVKITEDGSTKIIENAARIRTSLEGGGTCDWIPKDDVPLQELTVTEDGVYRPEEGYYGFSKITANGVGNAIEGDLIEKTVTKNGTYNIADESGSPYGYSKIIVNVDTSEDDGGGSGGGGGSPVVGKDEDGNDTMAETDDDGNVVMTALPTEIKVIIPPTKLDYTRYEDIDYSGISVYAYISKMVHWLGTTTTAVSEGSSNNTVSIGGNSVTASVGDGVLYAPDRTGANDIQLVWDGTKWVKPGNYSAEKAIWKSDKYKTGNIPFDELIFPMKRANSDMLEKEEKTKTISVGGYTGNIRIEKKIELNAALDVYQDTTVVYPLNWVYGGTAYFIPPYGPLMANGITSITAMGDEVVSAYKIIRTGTSGSPFSYSVIPYDPYYVFRGRCYGYAVIIASSTPNISYKISRKYSRPYYTEAYKKKQPLYPSFRTPDSGNPYNFQDSSYNLHTDSPNGDPTILVNNKDFESENIVVNHIANTPPYTKNGKTVYYTGISFGVSPDVEPDENIRSGQSENTHLENIVDCTYGYDFKPDTVSDGEIAWAIMYGDNAESDTMPISLPVQWKRPGDGKILETTFTAWMTDEGGDNNTSGSTTPGNQNIDVPQ